MTLVVRSIQKTPAIIEALLKYLSRSSGFRMGGIEKIEGILTNLRDFPVLQLFPRDFSQIGARSFRVPFILFVSVSLCDIWFVVQIPATLLCSISQSLRSLALHYALNCQIRDRASGWHQSQFIANIAGSKKPGRIAAFGSNIA